MPADSILESFRKLAISEGLNNKKSQTYKTKKQAFIGAAVRDGFLSNFGSNESSLQGWQDLCRTVGIVEDVQSLTSIKKCKQALKGTFVNLVDLVDAASASRVVSKTFSSRQQLATYIASTGKIFPKKMAKQNPLLRQFLIVVYG